MPGAFDNIHLLTHSPSQIPQHSHPIYQNFDSSQKSCPAGIVSTPMQHAHVLTKRPASEARFVFHTLAIAETGCYRI